MVGTAVVGAVIVSAAGRNALVAPFLAHEEGNGLRELGQVGAGTICADAFEGESIRIAFIGLGTTLLDAGKLEANERAGLFLVETPFVPLCLGNAFRVNLIDVLGNDGRREGEETVDGGEMHSGDDLVVDGLMSLVSVAAVWV